MVWKVLEIVKQKFNLDNIGGFAVVLGFWGWKLGVIFRRSVYQFQIVDCYGSVYGIFIDFSYVLGDLVFYLVLGFQVYRCLVII